MDDGLARILEESPSECSYDFCQGNGLGLNHVSSFCARRKKLTNQDNKHGKEKYRELPAAPNKQIHKGKSSKLQKEKKHVNICFDIVELFQSNRFCFDCLNFLRPLPEKPLEKLSNINEDQKLEILDGIESRIPFIIVLEEKQTFTRGKDGESIISHPKAKQKVLRRVEDLKVMLETDLGERITTTATEFSSQLNYISPYKILQSESSDITTLSDNEHKQTIAFARTMSSISISSLDNLSNYSLDNLMLSHNDPLSILDLNGDERDAPNNDERKNNCKTAEMNREISSNISGSASLSCGDSRCNAPAIQTLWWVDEYPDGDVNANIADSFISYEDLMSEGISYDEDESKLSSESIKDSYDCENDKALLDLLCEVSLQSQSIKSYAIENFCTNLDDNL